MTTPDHLVPLGDSSWQLWRLVAVRSAGFPVDLVLALTDHRLAEFADGEDASTELSQAYRDAYADATDSVSRALTGIAADPSFREAIAWQSPHLLSTCVDKLTSPAAGAANSKWRQRLLTTASYVQRYAVKNDSIGFFGPIAWATVTDSAPALTVHIGQELLARRTVYFEWWAIDAVARAMSDDPAGWPRWHLRSAPQNRLCDRTLITSNGKHLALTEEEALLLRECDGRRSLKTIQREFASELDLIPAALSLAERGLLLHDLDVPVSATPEDALAALLALQPDHPHAEERRSALDELLELRSAVADAAGDADRVITALDALGTAFERISGELPTRRPGQHYAGRTVVYEDTTRDMTIELGQPVVDFLAEPLELLLIAARWLSCRAAELFDARFSDIFDRLCARTGKDHVPLASLYSAATPDLFFSMREPPPLVDTLVREFGDKWSKVLAVDELSTRHHVQAADIKAVVEAEFASGDVPWSSAVHHSPDLMLVADSPEAVNRGDFLAVLGELHVAVNTMESRLFVAQAEDQAGLLRAAEHDHGDRRVVSLPSKESSQVNSRTYPAALLSSRFTYWSQHPDPSVSPGRIVPAGALRVVREGTRLVVRSDVDGRRFELVEMFGEAMSGAVLNSFRMLPSAPHRPRVSIDRLVVSRESWTFDALDLTWAALGDAAARHHAAWSWRRTHRLPERGFYRVPVEDKPIYLDFGSPVLVDLFARALRRTVRADVGTTVTFSEMLPDLDGTWLRDSRGRRYTSEFRLVLVDPLGLPADSAT